MKIFFLLISLCIFAIGLARFDFLKSSKAHVDEIHWAVLVAGSNAFWNYRHQSDVYHSYQVLLKNGMKPENIIVFAFDDIANNSDNPFPGKVFNKPDPNGPGVNVYEGIKIDYTLDTVTPENFLNVIQGKKDAMKGIGTGKVLESKETDNVFIYFSDHGATGFVAFPSDELYGSDLKQALVNMHTAKAYKRLVFYLEACESGSMFDDILPNNIDVYATTASTPSESSYATYCYPNDIVNNTSIGTCLGDEYSVNWIENSEDLDSNNEETLEDQFNAVKAKTIQSRVQQYGDMKYLNETIGDFEGYSENNKDDIIKKIRKFIRKAICKVRDFVNIPCQKLLKEKKAKEVEDKRIYKEYLDIARKSTIDSRKVKVHYLLHKAEKSNDIKYEEILKAELEHIEITDSIFDLFNKRFEIANGEIVRIINFKCLKNAVSIYKNKCNNWGEYDYIYSRNLAAACKKVDEVEINNFFSEVCSK